MLFPNHTPPIGKVHAPKLSHFFVLEIATSYKSFSFLHVCIWILDRGRFLSIFLRSKSLCKCLRLINSKCFYYILCFAICITWHCWLCLTLLHLLAFQVPFSNSSWCCLLPVVFIMHYCFFQLLITILIIAVSIVYLVGWISFFSLLGKLQAWSWQCKDQLSIDLTKSHT